MRQWHVQDKIHRRWVTLIIGTPEEFRGFLEMGGYTELHDIYPEKAQGMQIRIDDSNNTAGNQCNIIWLKEYKFSVLIHEMTHLLIDLYDGINTPINTETTEPAAYYMEFWVTEFLRVYKKYPKGLSWKQYKRGA